MSQKIIAVEGLGKVSIQSEPHTQTKKATLLNSAFIVTSLGKNQEEAINNLKKTYENIINSVEGSD